MHARNRTWLLGSDPVERCRQRTLPVEGGDGSTLSLDFTTGVLDPRLTFQRLSNATFINSSGQVKYAEQNLFFNTNFAGISGSNPTLSNVGWSYGFTAGTATFNGDGSVTMSASGGRYTINRTTSFTGSGRRIIVSVDITSNGDTGLIPTQLLRDGTLTNSVYYINSNLYTSGTVVGPCTLTFVADSPTAANSTPFFGVGTSGNVTATVTFARPRFGLWDGTFPLPYVVNTSSGASPSEYHAPRFDYDPTSIGTPRGLLIEGSANNICTWSQDFSNAAWQLDNAGASNPQVSTVPQTAPDGTNSVNRITFNKTGGTYSSIRQTLTGTAAANYTLSVWMKAYTAGGGASTQNVGLRIGADSSGFNCVVTTTWKRFQYTYALSGTNADAQIMLWDNITGNDETADVLIWGAQLEAGSGASSYIPTGASTGSRVADSCTIGVDAGTATNFSSWWPLGQAAWTVLWTGDIVRATTAVQFLWLTRTSGGSSLIRVFANSTSGQPLIGFAGNTVPPASTVNGTPGALIRTALANQEGDQAFYANNGTVSSSGTATFTGIPTTSANMNFNPNSDQFMHIKTLKFWPTRLPNAQLQSLTT